MEIIDAKYMGLLPEHDSVRPALIEIVRATIPALEALAAAGAEIGEIGTTTERSGLYSIDLSPVERMPPGLLACSLTGDCPRGIRLEDEPEYPRECGLDYWATVDLQPCPVCGAPLVWYEAAYVPGYRVCSRPPHHHCQAKEQPC